jgi:hypothetical protein
MVIGKLTSYLALGLVGAFLINALARPADAIGTAGALQETGKGIAAIGTGFGSSLSSLGQGGADLLKPLWELKNLLFDANVSGAASVGPVSQEQGTTNVKTGVPTPSSSTITWSSGTTATVPTLSAAARSFYGNLGVSVN